MRATNFARNHNNNNDLTKQSGTNWPETKSWTSPLQIRRRKRLRTAITATPISLRSSNRRRSRRGRRDHKKTVKKIFADRSKGRGYQEQGREAGAESGAPWSCPGDGRGRGQERTARDGEGEGGSGGAKPEGGKQGQQAFQAVRSPGVRSYTSLLSVVWWSEMSVRKGPSSHADAARTTLS
jgi:hypothetical protein